MDTAARGAGPNVPLAASCSTISPTRPEPPVAGCSVPAEADCAEERGGGVAAERIAGGPVEWMTWTRGAIGMGAEEFLVSTEDRPGWVRARERKPEVGQQVYCAGGSGDVVSV